MAPSGVAGVDRDKPDRARRQSIDHRDVNVGDLHRRDGVVAIAHQVPDAGALLVVEVVLEGDVLAARRALIVELDRIARDDVWC